MKKKLIMMLFVVTFFTMSAASASAVVNDTLLVGLRYGSTALFSANLENAIGAGYEFGYFDEDRDFIYLGETDEITISMTAAGTIYMNSSGTYSADEPSGKSKVMGKWHIQLEGFEDFDEAQEAAWAYDGYPAYIDGEYVVRIGCFKSKDEALEEVESLDFLREEEDLPADAPPADESPEDVSAAASYAKRSSVPEYSVVRSSDTGVIVTVTKTTDILFEFDCSGIYDFGVLPMEERGEDGTSTWFKGFKYAGGFSYPRVTGGDLHVVNVVDVEDYVKGVIAYEMNSSWPIEALKAQAVCARTYACKSVKHLSSYGFDVCNSTCCQVYYGHGSGVLYPDANSDAAVDETAGECLYYDGELVQDAVYHSSNGGATENCEYVWGSRREYLIGKEDPYEGEISIPNYEYSVTYTASELTNILKQKGADIGTVKNVYVSEYTPMGNVYKITFEGSNGSKTYKGDTCRTIFYSSTYNKSVKSLRYDINGGNKKKIFYVNDEGDTLSTMEDVCVISGSGEVSSLSDGTLHVLTEEGSATIKSGTTASSSTGSFTITGTGSGHNVGMSQYGAKAMAELGYDYEEILEFYYTDVTVE